MEWEIQFQNFHLTFQQLEFHSLGKQNNVMLVNNYRVDLWTIGSTVRHAWIRTPFTTKLSHIPTLTGERGWHSIHFSKDLVSPLLLQERFFCLFVLLVDIGGVGHRFIEEELGIWAVQCLSLKGLFLCEIMVSHFKELALIC